MISGSGEIISTDIDKGRVHDYKLFKKSRLPIKGNTCIRVDLGYIGIKRKYSNSEIPYKSSKLRPLSKEQKRANRSMARDRVVIEHINAKMKVFHILSHKYRNRRKRLGLRINLICALINLDSRFT